MSSIPELKQKKIERDARISQEVAVAEAKAEVDKSALIKLITERAQAYEDEYEQVLFDFKLFEVSHLYSLLFNSLRNKQ